MSARPNKGSEKRAFCPTASRDGRQCDFAEHPGAVHWSWVEGELQFWQALPEPGEAWRNLPAAEDPLRDAPQALRTARGPREFGVFVDKFAQVMEQVRQDPKGDEMSRRVHDLLMQGRTMEVYHRPLVEATTVEGQFAYGLLETPYSSGHGQPVVHETVPESGRVSSRVVVEADSLREVLVPGHRGDCAGDCCREGYSEETSYPECWTWDQVRDGTAEKYRAWKDWVL